MITLKVLLAIFFFLWDFIGAGEKHAFEGVRQARDNKKNVEIEKSESISKLNFKP